MNIRLLAASAALSLLSACGGGGGDSGSGGGGSQPTPRPNPNPTAPTMSCSPTGLAAAATSLYPVVCMLTSRGEMVFELYDTEAPITVANFLDYVRTNFYSSTLVHRVDRNFVFQGGGYLSGMQPKAATFAPIALEDNTRLSNLKYTLAMARRSDPNTATSEWFVNMGDNTFLDGIPTRRGYAIFGQIISGRAVADQINNEPVYQYSTTDIQPQTEVLTYWVQRVR